MKLIIITLITNWTKVTGVKKGEKFTTKYILQDLGFLIKDFISIIGIFMYKCSIWISSLN